MPARRKSVELSIKKQALDWIATEGGGVPSRAEAHFRQRGWRISAACFREWWRKRDEILAAAGSRRRLEGGGRRPVFGELEDTLVDMIYDLRISKEKVTREWIAAQARELFHSSRTEEEAEEHPIRFTASDPWVSSFMQRHGFSLRRRTNLTTLTDEELVRRAVSFMSFLETHKDVVGRRHVVIHSTGFASMRITAAFAVTASGKKLPPCLIWKRKTRGPIERLGGCYVSDGVIQQ
ncbi:hypothetical protein F443_14791 [Phytophthora nicotianae P1569]|uniref:HTH CENPB-type domain-containing protein n=1 Tax=Phytophthora nicotianae P1569 TaxID=1317065 RepID=V9EK54_PHYNI|nr:hypothetical protein F443_14791 [Phytophthora nicotianae P1569]